MLLCDRGRLMCTKITRLRTLKVSIASRVNENKMKKGFASRTSSIRHGDEVFPRERHHRPLLRRCFEIDMLRVGVRTYVSSVRVWVHSRGKDISVVVTHRKAHKTKEQRRRTWETAWLYAGRTDRFARMQRRYRDRHF